MMVRWDITKLSIQFECMRINAAHKAAFLRN
jgi:hypothetical protein